MLDVQSEILFCVDNDTKWSVVTSSCVLFLCLTFASIAKEILCLSYHHIQCISHRSGCFSTLNAPFFLIFIT